MTTKNKSPKQTQRHTMQTGEKWFSKENPKCKENQRTDEMTLHKPPVANSIVVFIALEM